MNKYQNTYKKYVQKIPTATSSRGLGMGGQTPWSEHYILLFLPWAPSWARLYVTQSNRTSHHHLKEDLHIWWATFQLNKYDCLHAKREEQAQTIISPTCKQVWSKKKSNNPRVKIQIKFWLHHCISYVKIFKTIPHLTIFWKFYFSNIFLIKLERMYYCDQMHISLRTNY